MWNTLYSQTTYTIGTGSSTTTSTPINSLFVYSYSQSIYPASALTAQGMSAGMEITTLRYYVDGSSYGTVNTNNQWDVYMGNTTSTTFGTTSAWLPVASMSQVYSGTVTWTNGGWMTITLANPFIWNGQNLVIAVDENSSGYSYPVYFRYTSGATNSTIYHSSDGTNTSPTSPNVANSRNSNLPNIQLVASLPPPAPIQDPITPSCMTGSALSMVGTPAAGDTWYWQTTATGTSTANNAVNPWTVYANGTYYVRTYTAATNSWSVANSIAVSNFQTAPTPPAPFAGANPACNSTQLATTAPPAGTIYYWQTIPNGSNSANNASIPLDITTSGTYYLAAFEEVTGCWSSTSSQSVVIETALPANPISTFPVVNACSGSSSIQISGQAQGLPVTYKIRKMDSWGDGWNGAYINVLVDGVVVLNNITLSGGSSEDQSFSVTEGSVITTVLINGGSFASEISYQLVNQNNVLVGSVGNQNNQINYTVPMGTYPLTWYDAPTGGNIVGTGSPIETVGSTLITDPATSGTYAFYLAASLGACESAERFLVNVNVTTVNVLLETTDASCNNGNDGSFSLGTISCGTAPFTYDIDNSGTFSTATGGLSAGTHTVVVRDVNGELSAPYTIEIGSASGPSDVIVASYTDESATVSWTATGSETEWNIEWGLPGFTPGTGTSVGSSSSTSTSFMIPGLSSSTEYDIYVSANCGSATTAGDWAGNSVTTECGSVTVPWCEDFEPTTGSFDCWTQLDLNNDGVIAGTGNWTYADWAIWDNEDIDEELATSGVSFATNFNQGQVSADDWLITPRITLTGNEVLKFNYVTFNYPTGFRVLLSTTGKEPADFTETLMAQATYSNITFMDTTVNLSDYNTNVYIAFVRSGTTPTYSGVAIDDVCVLTCVPIAGTDGATSVCRDQGTLDLSSVITSLYDFGQWSNSDLQSFINGTNLNFSNLIDGSYNFDYVVEGACSTDTTVATITIVSPLSAGTDGTLNVCKNQPIGLFNGLTGNVDYGGTWYNAAGVALTGSTFTTGTLQGQQVYTYVVSNGICDADTAQVIVNIGSCNFVGVEDVDMLDNVTVSPNPSTGVFHIEGVKSPEFTYEVVDVNGRVIKGETKITSSVTSVNLSEVETGIYMIRLKGEGSEKLIRLIKQ